MTATPTQRLYIKNLAVKKTKEFKEVKEMVIANQIVGENAELVKNAQSLDEITDNIDPAQATRLIEALIAKDEPKRGTFSDRRVKQMIDGLADIIGIIDDWDFETMEKMQR